MPNNKKKIFSILLMLGVYLLSAGLSYSWFSGSSVANIFASPLVTDLPQSISRTWGIGPANVGI